MSGLPQIDLYAVASHDLRQIPQALDLMLGALQRARTDDERKRCLQGIAHAADMLRQMEALLSRVSKWQRGVVGLDHGKVTLGDVVRDSIAALASGAMGTPEIHKSGLDVEVSADRLLLTMLSEGMLLLALKFKTRGPVAIEAHRAGKQVELKFSFEGNVPATALHDMAFVEHGIDDTGRPRLGAGPALAHAAAAAAGMGLQLNQADGRTAATLAMRPA